MKLDRSKPFGKIAGDMFIPDGCDRPAHYEQAGMFFDAHDRVIEPGKSASIVPTEDDDDDVVDAPEMTVAQLLQQADMLHWRKFKAHAAKVLGAECPASKSAIIEKLHEVQKEFDARLAQKKKAAPAPVVVAATVAGKGVDLAAWARGQKEYLFGDIRKAIKAQYGRNVQERDDAVEFLVEQGVVYAEHARQDVLRKPE